MAARSRGYRRRLFLQSKAIEIICQMFEAFDHSGRLHLSRDDAADGAGGVEGAAGAAPIIWPPRLRSRCWRAASGLAAAPSCSGFAARYSASPVFDYVHGLRMQQALELLNERDASITQIAYAVGYNRGIELHGRRSEALRRDSERTSPAQRIAAKLNGSPHFLEHFRRNGGNSTPRRSPIWRHAKSFWRGAKDGPEIDG